MQRLSVVIPNHNHERFVGQAIDSALAMDWADLEVVVVDDGSTDGSVDLIRSYGNRVRLLATTNASHRVAVNRGYAMSTGDVVIVLDSDDVLPPDLPAQLALAWGPGVSKAQFRMQRIDEAGLPMGSPFPRYWRAPTSADLRHWMMRTSAYPTPPGSGNAYARWFLDRVMPIDEAIGDYADSALLAVAPILGEIVTVPDVVVGYRQHTDNDSDLLADPTRFAREVDRARNRWALARRVALPVALDERALFRSRELLQFRVAAERSTPGPATLVGDGRSKMLRDALVSPFHPGPEPVLARIAVALWSIGTLTGPPWLARRLIRLRYRRRS